MAQSSYSSLSGAEEQKRLEASEAVLHDLKQRGIIKYGFRAGYYPGDEEHESYTYMNWQVEGPAIECKQTGMSNSYPDAVLDIHSTLQELGIIPAE